MIKNRTKQCRKCPFGCDDCQSSLGAKCLKCSSGFYKFGDGCRDPIPFCSFVDKENGYCIVCNYGYRLLKGRCAPCLDQLGGVTYLYYL